jgi:predicted TIM-barrel fold metal-dependent hydrolase
MQSGAGHLYVGARITTNMIIDGHAHACGPFLRAEGIVQALDAAGADRVVLVSGEADSEKTYSLPRVARRFPNTDVVAWTNRLTRAVIALTGGARHIAPGNEHVYRLSQELPDRVIPFHWVSLNRQVHFGVLERLYDEQRFRGLKLHQCWERFRVFSENFEAVMSWAEQKGLPVFIHLYDRRGVRELIDYLRHHPDAKVIVGHLFGLEDYIASGLRFERVVFDTSTHELVSTQRILKAIEHFGVQQVVMGSDTPYARDALRLAIACVRSLPLSDPEKNSILGENLRRLLEPC